MIEEKEREWTLTLGELIEIIGTVVDGFQWPCPMHFYDADQVVAAVEKEKRRK